MTKEEMLVKDLTKLVRDRTAKGWHLGIRVETEEIDPQIRSKTIRAYIVDLFGDYDHVDGLHELEEAICDSIEK